MTKITVTGLGLTLPGPGHNPRLTSESDIRSTSDKEERSIGKVFPEEDIVCKKGFSLKGYLFVLYTVTFI